MTIFSRSRQGAARDAIPIPGQTGDGKIAVQCRLEGGNVRCLQALGTFGDVEFNCLAVGKGSVPLSLNRGEVHENVLT